MTKRDFFIVSIKLFGLFSAATYLFSVLPVHITTIFMSTGNADATAWVLVIASPVIMLSLFVLLILKAHKLADLLRIGKGFDSDWIKLGELNSGSIFKIAIIVIGGLMVLDNIPQFLHYAVSVFGDRAVGSPVEPDVTGWILNGLKLLVGYLLVKNYRLAARLLEAKDKKIRLIT